MTKKTSRVAVRAFEPWRRAKTEKAKALVREVARHIEAEEDHRGWRRRARRPEDQKAFEATIEALVCDLAHLHLSKSLDAPTRLTITRSKDDLASGPRRYRAPPLSKQLLDILDRMHLLEHLVQRKGDRSRHARVFTQKLNETRPRQATTIEPGPVLVWRMTHHGVTFGDLGISPADEVIILKCAREDRWDTAVPIDYPETPETRRYREEVRHLNGLYAAADISVLGLPHVDANDRHLRRIFTRASFTSGGRLSGGFWMNMERDLRLTHVHINGERVASIDFNNFYAHLLYAKVGAIAPERDLYLFPGLEAYRKGMKRLFSARLFDSDPRTSKPRRKPKEVREGVQLYPDNMDIGELLRILETGNRPIAGFFGSGIGHSLQFVESEVLMRILGELEQAGVVGLPVHDCVVVPRSAAEKTKEIMAKVTKEETGVSIPVSVEISDEERTTT